MRRNSNTNLYPIYIVTTLSEEDLYALFRLGASIERRGASQCIDLRSRLKSKRHAKKAEKAGIKAEVTDDIPAFWNILNNVLNVRHSTSPVHSAEEMKLLQSRFPENIRLHAAFSPDGQMLAGAWVFISGQVVHTQYLASSDTGRTIEALDYLIQSLIDTYSDKDYLDFGISTENGGHVLNEGLAFQKEGFGGRSICYDQYRLKL